MDSSVFEEDDEEGDWEDDEDELDRSLFDELKNR